MKSQAKKNVDHVNAQEGNRMSSGGNHILFRGGVHPREGKDLSSGKAIQTPPLLDKYTVILNIELNEITLIIYHA